MKNYFILILSILLVCQNSFAQEKKGRAYLTRNHIGFKNKASFPIGTAVDIKKLRKDATYKEIVLRDFNSITAENCMKASYLHVGLEEYNWADADYLVDFATENKMRLHGHTLVWYLQNPKWLTEFKGDSAAWENLLKTHIQTIVKHFKGKVKSWDVVNEAFSDSAGVLRKNIWLEHLGAGYLERSFQYAHEADPKALLFYNDYDMDGNPDKKKAMIAMVENFRKKKIPIHGIGIQTHAGIDDMPPIKNIESLVNDIVKLGLKVHVSEIEISVNLKTGKDTVLTQRMIEAQQKTYTDIIKIYQTVPLSQQFGFTFWGFSDEDTWIRHYMGRRDWPLPYDESYNPKPVYWTILEQLESKKK